MRKNNSENIKEKGKKKNISKNELKDYSKLKRVAIVIMSIPTSVDN